MSRQWLWFCARSVGFLGRQLFPLVNTAIQVTSLLIPGNCTSSFSIGTIIAQPMPRTDLSGMNLTLTDYENVPSTQ